MSFEKKLYPWSGLVGGKFAVECATLWGLGSLKAPGTWGSAFGVLFYGAVFHGLSFAYLALFGLVLSYLAMGICDAAEKELKKKDPGEINLDEFAAIPFCFLPFCGYNFSSPAWLFAGFAFFRLFDIFKPFGISKIQKLDGGAGCVLDDTAAALSTCAVLNILYCLMY